MAVPNNFTFTLQDVVNEIGCAGNMQACVDNANPSGYDSNYSSESGLRKFRNYTHVTDSISLSSNYVSFWQNGSPKNSDPVVTSSDPWTAAVDFDSDNIIDSYTTAGNSQDPCYLSMNPNWSNDYSATAQITFTCGSASAQLNICEDGTVETCS